MRADLYLPAYIELCLRAKGLDVQVCYRQHRSNTLSQEVLSIIYCSLIDGF